MDAVKVHDVEGTRVVRFNDRELTEDEQILQIAKDLTEVLTTVSTGTRLLLDFQDVERVSSLMWGELVALNKAALHKGFVLQICRLSPDVMRIIKSCHLNQVFDILDDPPA